MSNNDQPDPRDVRAMNDVEKKVIGFLAQITSNRGERLEAAILAGALLRVVRRLYSKYPDGVRKDLEEGAVAFLTGVDVEGQTKYETLVKRFGLGRG